ncbi:MAG: DegT/DnrJ/EryC1/StrS family aminotransferase [Actinomycetota bacterium]
MNFLVSDPRQSYLAHKEEIDAEIKSVLGDGSYILGPKVEAFERTFGGYIGHGAAVGVGSGTDALTLALKACGVGVGDAVITVSNAAVAPVAAIELCGAIPLLVDIDPITFTIDPQLIQETLTGWYGQPIKAIIPVHLYGQPADMTSIMELAHQHGLFVIEDCAQSAGAAIRGKKTGAWGEVSAFSFYPTKNLGALGDGGAVLGQSDLVEKARMLRQYGWQERLISMVPGMNSRLDELQAAVLTVKLKFLDRENELRRALASIYNDHLGSTSLVLPQPQAEMDHVFHQYVVRSTARDSLKRFLKANSIQSAIHYPIPVHLQPAYQNRTPLGAGGMVQTEIACAQVLSLPVQPHLAPAEAREIASAIVRWEETRS